MAGSGYVEQSHPDQPVTRYVDTTLSERIALYFNEFEVPDITWLGHNASALSLWTAALGVWTPDVAKQELDLILEAATRLRLLTDGMRDYIKLDGYGGKTVALAEAVEGAIGLLNGAVEEKGARISVERLPDIQVDSMLQQVFYNLFSNAIKYVAHDVSPDVRVKYEERTNHHTFIVSDNGVGFSQDDAERIFGLSTRLYPAGSPFWGSGIGLAVVREHVERLGGRVWAESSVGEGASFTVVLPKKSTDHEHTPDSRRL